jgi:hypothetical protein
VTRALAAAVLAVAVTLSPGVAVAADKRPKCGDRMVKILQDAGFRGWQVRHAWAITWRESKHQNLDERSRYFTGALGTWQVQTSAHSRNRWWSRAAMLNPARQSRIVYLHMTKRGTYWRPWGLTADGRLDATHYAGWSAWQREAWIMRPYRQGLALYPRGCPR